MSVSSNPELNRFLQLAQYHKEEMDREARARAAAIAEQQGPQRAREERVARIVSIAPSVAGIALQRGLQFNLRHQPTKREYIEEPRRARDWKNFKYDGSDGRGFYRLAPDGPEVRGWRLVDSLPGERSPEGIIRSRSYSGLALGDDGIIRQFEDPSLVTKSYTDFMELTRDLGGGGFIIGRDEHAISAVEQALASLVNPGLNPGLHPGW